LTRISIRSPHRLEYRVDLSKKEVAQAIATTPETLSRVIGKMEDDQLLEWDKKRISLAAAAWDMIKEE